MIALASGLLGGSVGALAVVVVGDAATAAAIAGMFSVVNTGLTALLLRYARGTRRQVESTHGSVAKAAITAAAAAEAATEACRVAKSIGRNLRHEDPIVIARSTPPEATEPDA